MTYSAVLQPAEEGGYVAFNPETGTSTQGETIDEALSNLKEATELYLEEFPMPQQGRALMTSFEIPAQG
jgi:predicted RNase H-like HicB family nuclease